MTRLTHPDKVLWPANGGRAITKQDLADYLDAASDRILPHIKGRPLSVVRAPDGIAGETFFQRHMMKGTEGLTPIKVKGDAKPYFTVDTKAGLRALAQAGVVEFHPWGCKPGEPETPGLLVFDIDPAKGLPFSAVVEAAKDVAARLKDCGLVPFAKMTGGKGMHVVAAIKGTKANPVTWDDAKTFARDLCQAMERAEPKRFTTNARMAQRGGKLFLDYLRNAEFATAVAPWSPRGRPGATIALPLTWKDVNAKLDPHRFTILTAKTYLKKPDPWAGLAKSARSLAAAQKKLEKL